MVASGANQILNSASAQSSPCILCFDLKLASPFPESLQGSPDLSLDPLLPEIGLKLLRGMSVCACERGIPTSILAMADLPVPLQHWSRRRSLPCLLTAIHQRLMVRGTARQPVQALRQVIESDGV